LWADLVKAVPDEHKKFLADLVWVHEEVRLVLVALLFLFYTMRRELLVYNQLVHFPVPSMFKNNV